jgi:hypothetical protein
MFRPDVDVLDRSSAMGATMARSVGGRKAQPMVTLAVPPWGWKYRLADARR